MTADSPMRLGFAVKLLGQPHLKSNDARRWQSSPHLRVSIEYLHAIFDHIASVGIDMYRMSSDVAPYATHPDMPQFHNQVRECKSELRALGDHARRLGLRLSAHPSQFVILNAPDAKIVKQSVRDLECAADLFDAMGLGPEAVLVVHVGGTYGDRPSGRARWVETYNGLSGPVRRRLVLENDDIRYSAADVLLIHDECGVPLIFDHQHHCCLNPERSMLRPTLERFLASWPAGVRPKIHYSSPRTELREVKRKNKATGKTEAAMIPPIWTGHADYVNPFEFGLFLDVAAGLVFDVMVEAKAKELAVLRLKRDLPRYLPGHAGRFGVSEVAGEAEEEESVEG